MNRLAWVWASPPDESLLGLAGRLEQGDLPEPREVLKHNRHRTVWLLPAPGGGLILKHYRERGGEALKTRLLGGRAEREFRAMEEFCRAGLPSARPVAYADRRARGRLDESWFLSREVPDAVTLHAALRAAPADGERAQGLARRAIELVAEMHEHPFWHRDLHAGNLLLDARDQLVVIDLHSIWRVPFLADAQRWENLSRLLFSMRESVDLERAPALMAHYARQRGEPEERVVRAMSRALRRFADDAVRGRAARCMRDSSEYEGCRTERGRLHHRREYAAECLEADIVAHLAAEQGAGPLLSDARASRVSRVEPGWTEARIVKHYLPSGAGPALRARLGMGRARGAWRFARRCRVLGVPTPQALALLEQPDGSAWLVTREVPDAQSLTDWAESLGHRRLGAPDRRLVARAVGHVVGRLSRSGLRHDDMSGKNVLLGSGPAEAVVDLRLRPDPSWPRVDLVDLDNMRRTRPHDPAALERMLGQLGDLPQLTRGDRLRFALGFQAGAGRGLPPAAVRAAQQRTRARQERRARLTAARSAG